jgi:hypothetical protein
VSPTMFRREPWAGEPIANRRDLCLTPPRWRRRRRAREDFPSTMLLLNIDGDWTPINCRYRRLTTARRPRRLFLQAMPTSQAVFPTALPRERASIRRTRTGLRRHRPCSASSAASRCQLFHRRSGVCRMLPAPAATVTKTGTPAGAGRLVLNEIAHRHAQPNWLSPTKIGRISSLAEKLDTSGKSPAYLQHRSKCKSPRPKKPAAGFFFLDHAHCLEILRCAIAHRSSMPRIAAE